MRLSDALPLAQEILKALEPHCSRIEIAGSIRRKKPEVNDIEIVCIPHPYDTGIFESGVASVINQWEKVKGELPCKYTQRIVKGMKIDIFFATPINWGLIFAIRTGSAEYSHQVLAKGWVKRGYVGKSGNLYYKGKLEPVPEEKQLFRIIGIPYVEPENRNL